MWNLFRKTEERDMTNEALLTALSSTAEVNRDNVLNIPAVAGAIELIASTFAMIPIKLYKRKGNSSEYQKKDIRNKFLNIESGDKLNAYEIKEAMCRDYLIEGNAYTYIEKKKGTFSGLYYVDSMKVSISESYDPIYKVSQIRILDKEYQDYELLTLLRHTKNGVKGFGILKENAEQLNLMYSLIGFENKLIARGGIKNGFLESDKPLAKDAFESLKSAWKSIFTSRGENAVVLNQGVKFHEASTTSTELQLNESKQTNSKEIAKMFNIPIDMFNANVSDTTYRLFIKQTIQPICEAFEQSLNRNLLLENEKEDYYFAFDYSEILKGDVKDRYEAYGEAIKDGILTINEVREKEHIKAIDGMNIIPMTLGQVLYDVDEKKYFTPNTGLITDLQNPQEINDGNGKQENGSNGQENSDKASASRS